MQQLTSLSFAICVLALMLQAVGVVPDGGFIRHLKRDPRWRNPFLNPNVYLYLKVASGDPYSLRIVDALDSTADK